MPLSAAIAASGLGDNTVVAGVAGKRIVVVGWALSVSAAVNAKWKDGASTDKTGLYYFAAAGTVSRDAPENEEGDDFLFSCTAGNALVLNLSGAIAVGGDVDYRLET